MFDELLAHDGVDEIVELRSSFGFMAFHGGSLEAGTDDIARSAAATAGASLYAVVQPSDLQWHVPSVRVSPDRSPALARFLTHVDVVVAVHDYGRVGMWTSLLLGGRNRALAAHVGGHLRTALTGWEVVDDLDRIPHRLRGLHGDNPVNRTGGGGVQLELPPRVRGLGPWWDDRPVGERTAVRQALVEGLAAAARGWPGPDR
ncbi:hypothetical protein BH24ACT3_BH24ACT3_10630 [soil metagenome]